MTFNPTDDIINSDDIINQFNDLCQSTATGQVSYEQWNEQVALATLIDFCEKQNTDWRFGVSLINESYFVEYIKDQMIDCNHEEFKNMPKIFKDNIDWESVAETCKVDYSEVEYMGQTFYILCS